jgi:hypothetical protein
MREATLKVIAVCSALSTTVVVGGAIFLLNDRYNWTGQLMEWDRQAGSERELKQFWDARTNEARLLVGDEKLAFIVRGCVPEQTDRPPDMLHAMCVLDIAEVMSKDCPQALKYSWVGGTVGTAYRREKAAGLVKFDCPPSVQPTTVTALPPLSPFPTPPKVLRLGPH